MELFQHISMTMIFMAKIKESTEGKLGTRGGRQRKLEGAQGLGGDLASIQVT